MQHTSLDKLNESDAGGRRRHKSMRSPPRRRHKFQIDGFFRWTMMMPTSKTQIPAGDANKEDTKPSQCCRREQTEGPLYRH
ncbi:hypothetical protein Nepgr_024532 [Nepenthes gracilis]|uniref:Uncharacterized protein n=1 Tax=Nepenthes gracilis TaxID=150966 RepID=A0AAD3T4S1_NEPGR|nr:hypothetical protein Nepgr_024532 [Nepenthes gracilis]